MESFKNKHPSDLGSRPRKRKLKSDSQKVRVPEERTGRELGHGNQGGIDFQERKYS